MRKFKLHVRAVPKYALFAPLINRNYRKLWAAQLLSETGDWAARLAVSMLVYERTNSPALLALTVVVSTLPWVGIGPLLATFGDRYPRHTIMVTADIVRALCSLLLAAADMPVWLVLVVLFGAGLATPPFAAARSSILPDVLGEKLYKQGLGLAQVTQNLGLVAGYAFGGLIIAAIGTKGALAVNAGTFVLSAALLLGLRYERTSTGHARAAVRLRLGWRSVWSNSHIRSAALLVAIGHAGASAIESFVVPIADVYFGSSAQYIGILAAASAVGTVTGSVILSRGSVPTVAAAVRQSAAIIVGLSSVAILLFSIDFSFISLALGFMAVGMVFSTIVPLNTAIGLQVPAEQRASIFGVLQSSLYLTHALAIAAFGIFAEHMPLQRVAVGGLVASTVFVFLTWFRYRRQG